MRSLLPIGIRALADSLTSRSILTGYVTSRRHSMRPLWQQLAAQPKVVEIRGYLWYKLRDHFGLDPTSCAADEITDRLVSLATSWNTDS